MRMGLTHEQLEPWYAKLNPRLVVPTLEIDGEILTDSRRIVEQIDVRFPGPCLIPADLRDEVVRWVDLQDRLPMRELEIRQSKGLVRWLRHWDFKRKRKQAQARKKRLRALQRARARETPD